MNMLKEFNNLLLDSSGNLKSFDNFYKDAKKISDVNKNWLKAEYNYVYASSTEARKWASFTNNGKEMDVLLRIKVVVDGRTRHQAFHNLTFPANHPFWQKYSTPFAYNCRCTIIKVFNKEVSEIPKDLPKMEKTFSNAFLTGKVYKDHHPFIEKLNSKEKVKVQKVVNKIIKKEIAEGEFKPAKSVGEAIERLKSFTTPAISVSDKYQQNIRFTGLKLEHLNPILRAAEGTLGKYDVVVNDIGTQISSKSSLGTYWRAYGSKKIEGLSFASDSVQLQKSFILKSKEVQESTMKNFLRNKENNLEQINRALDSNRPESLKVSLRKKKRIMEFSKRWSAYSEPSVDALEATARHEFYHAVYFRKNLERRFMNNLTKHGVDREDWYKVSEYGGSKIEELWTETGVCIDFNIDIPEGIKKAFLDTVG